MGLEGNSVSPQLKAINPTAEAKTALEYLQKPDEFNMKGPLRVRVRPNANVALLRKWEGLLTDKPHVDPTPFREGTPYNPDQANKAGQLMPTEDGGLRLSLDARGLFKVAVDPHWLGSDGIFELTFEEKVAPEAPPAADEDAAGRAALEALVERVSRERMRQVGIEV